MKYPNFSEEKKLWKQGYQFIVGLDEAGRGPLAGPVVAAAVFIKNTFIKEKHSDILQNVRMFLGIRDSKTLTEKQREFFYEQLTNHKDIVFGVGIVSEKVIDKVNILEATKLAMQKALENMYHKSNGRKIYGTADFLLIDGNFILHMKHSFAKSFGAPKQKSIIKGDSKVFSITAAGIIAKVTRDRIMRHMHIKYPEYGFDKHKGYGTAAHVIRLQNLGVCKIHRKSFEPVKTLVKTEIV